MIINHKYKFIFFRTRKTASTSAAIALSRFCGKDDIITPLPDVDEDIRCKAGGRGPQNYSIHPKWYGRLDWLVAIRTLRLKEFPRHATASFVKRYVSEEIWSTYFKFCFERNPYDKAISRYYWTAQEPRPPISKFLDDLETTFLTNWDIYTINDHIALDFVGRYENLLEDMEAVRNRLGLPEEIMMPKAKGMHRENRDHYSAVLDSSARKRIEVVCAKEIAALGYEWEEM
jgi:hypothetical protein